MLHILLDKDNYSSQFSVPLILSFIHVIGSSLILQLEVSLITFYLPKLAVSERHEKSPVITETCYYYSSAHSFCIF